METTLIRTPTIDSHPNPFSLTTYSNPYRQLALALCGWDFVSPPHLEVESKVQLDESLEAILQELEAKGDFEQAAGWALFHGASMDRAIQALNSSHGACISCLP